MHQLFVALFTSGKAGISLSNPNYITEIKEWRHLSGSAGTQPEFLFIWLIREVPVALGEILPDNLLLSEVKNITLSCRHETLTQADVEAAAALRIFFFFPSCSNQHNSVLLLPGISIPCRRCEKIPKNAWEESQAP